ncbi:nucleotide sugar dehydrogenase [Sphingomonas sp.]|uniref:nucleotide sugar dehydrogenase n=1 Tax=Sphingomonas sp. TaxID=28214 RepID=UPI00286CC96B|nr:nucleotide sugar dehydrogenase [Sphingomonas sp.]
MIIDGKMKIAVIGLGYVGLPLAVALARKFDVVGIDIDQRRIDELRDGHDRTGEIERDQLAESRLAVSADPEAARAAAMYIVTVPTPVDADNQPDLSAVEAATRTVAALVDPAICSIIVYESTVYPGVTEDLCGGLLEAAGLRRGRDFKLGYSPERINPGDKVHSVDKIIKVIAGEDEEVVETLAQVYGAITSAGVFRAASIRAAEAAKVIENAQRDINVAFMNEVTQIMAGIGVSAWDVLDAAKTKWNFLGFEPGLVGGHCIGVDPFYLSHLAQSLGHHPQVILAGRETNDAMGEWIADQLHAHRGGKPGRALLMGLTFKENVPDMRNSRSIDLFRRLTELGHQVDIADPHVGKAEAQATYGRGLSAPGEARYDLVVGAVRHEDYRAMDGAALGEMLTPGGTLADIKGMWRSNALATSLDYWTL